VEQSTWKKIDERREQQKEKEVGRNLANFSASKTSEGGANYKPH